MWGVIITFLKNFSLIARILKWAKSFFSPISIVAVAIVALLLGGNYYFYKSGVKSKKELKKQALKYKNLSSNLEELKAKNIQIQKLLNEKQTEFKKVTEKIQTLHVKQIKEASLHAKQKEKNKHLKDAPIAPVLRSTLNGLFGDE